MKPHIRDKGKVNLRCCKKKKWRINSKINKYFLKSRETSYYHFLLSTIIISFALSTGKLILEWTLMMMKKKIAKKKRLNRIKPKIDYPLRTRLILRQWLTQPHPKDLLWKSNHRYFWRRKWRWRETLCLKRDWYIDRTFRLSSRTLNITICSFRKRKLSVRIFGKCMCACMWCGVGCLLV